MSVDSASLDRDASQMPKPIVWDEEAAAAAAAAATNDNVVELNEEQEDFFDHHHNHATSAATNNNNSGGSGWQQQQRSAAGRGAQNDWSSSSDFNSRRGGAAWRQNSRNYGGGAMDQDFGRSNDAAWGGGGGGASRFAPAAHHNAYSRGFESSRRNRSRSRSPPVRRNFRNDRGASFGHERSPTRSANFETSKFSSQDIQTNPVVLQAFQKLISDATLGLVAGENEMLSFKQFIAQSECNFDEQEAVKQYNIYKKQFKHDQLIKFYKNHKDFDWFKKRYDDSAHTEAIQARQTMRKQRLDVFIKLYDELDMIVGQSVEINNQAKLNELLEMASVMIEGGSIDDLERLNKLTIAGNLDTNCTEGRKEAAQTDPDMGIENEQPGDEMSGEMEPEKDSLTLSNTYHKNTGLFIREFPEALGVNELHDFCSKFGDVYKRVCVHDPSHHSGFNKCKVWLTFSINCDINLICAEFNKHVFSDGKSYSAVVCRHLHGHIRPVSALSLYREIMVEDLKNAVNLVILNDRKWGFFQTSNSPSELSAPDEFPNLNNLSIESHNPLLKNISSLIVEEVDYNELDDKQLSNTDTNAFSSHRRISSETGSTQNIQLNVDDELKKRLDPLLLYLRIVHSIDYYTGVELVDESLQPHVISLFHSRGDMAKETISSADIDDMNAQQKRKLHRLLLPRTCLQQEEIDFAKFEEVTEALEKFNKSQAQEITAEKWLCLICSKKFRDFPFIAKHINNKHGAELEKVTEDVKLFNNYLADSTRPQMSLQGLGRYEDSASGKKKVGSREESLLNKEKSYAQLYNTALNRLTSQPVLMATLINQVVLGESSMTMKNAQRVFANSTNFDESRTMLPYTDVDNF